jgi:hypothetical protein
MTSTSEDSGTASETSGISDSQLFQDDGWDLEPTSCDPFAQDCPDGEKCVSYASNGNTWDSHKCVPVLGSQPAGEPCAYGGVVDATDDCDSDTACWNVHEVDGEWVGTCHWFCAGNPEDPSCPEGTFCPLTGDGTIALCVWSCDPVLQDCAESNGCYWAGDEFVCVFTTMDIPAGEACEYVNDCASGLLCTDADSLPSCLGAACCTPFCDLMLGDAQCDAVPGTSCVPFFEDGMAPANYAHVGVCIVP